MNPVIHKLGSGTACSFKMHVTGLFSVFPDNEESAPKWTVQKGESFKVDGIEPNWTVI